ncbi:MAG: hypothetical protein GTO26_11830, partial [Planctomycetales bacterium]|nr:hypothetical protein [Planctomycetales bacterium]
MVEDTDMNSASLSRMDDLAAGVGFRDFLFTDFVDDQMDPVDFASIKSIMLQINADVSTEFTISLILSRGTNGNGNGVFATPEP